MSLSPTGSPRPGTTAEIMADRGVRWKRITLCVLVGAGSGHLVACGSAWKE